MHPFKIFSALKATNPSANPSATPNDVEMGMPELQLPTYVAQDTPAPIPQPPLQIEAPLTQVELQAPSGLLAGSQDGAHKFTLRIPPPGDRRRMPTRRSRSPSGPPVKNQPATGSSKVQVVERDDPQKDGLLEAQARQIEMLKEELTRNTEVFQAFKTQMEEMAAKTEAAEEKAKAAEMLHKADPMAAFQEQMAAMQAKITASEQRAKEIEEKASQWGAGLEAQMRQAEEARTCAEQQAAELEQEHKRKMAEISAQRILDKEGERHAQIEEVETPNTAGDTGGTPVPDRQRYSTPDTEMAGASTNKGKAPQQSAPSWIPKPATFKTASSSSRETTSAHPLPTSFPSRRQTTQSPAGSRATSPPVHTSPPLHTLDLEGKIDLILSNMNLCPVTMPRRRHGPSEFRHPVVRMKEEGQNERNNLVRKHMNRMLGIVRDDDIVDIELDDFTATETLRQREMALYEKNCAGRGPSLEPLHPNWGDISSRWNERLAELFIEYCVRNGYIDEDFDYNDQEEIRKIFSRWLGTLKAKLNLRKPKGQETKEDAEARAKAKEEAQKAENRRHGRCHDLYNIRVNGAATRLPEDDERIDPQTLKPAVHQIFNDHHATIALGREGMSSDESCDEEDSSMTYRVHHLEWRSTGATRQLKRDDERRKKEAGRKGRNQGRRWK
ncbi:hypothetical protein NLJ89_g11389 [Agrocybe chaxingu]|uniref:Uncharacterized protein n=1 Tax=Agrocybe chaxingu TaxID=84603 RepID=A0A9W8JSH2_9AGAR|nr:hypothetical protein NLJ89_g11389 [Agrocybe chaxingu]